jgi:hypothetical protein
MGDRILLAGLWVGYLRVYHISKWARKLLKMKRNKQPLEYQGETLTCW